MIREKTPASDIVIDLDGPKGNAFYLLSYAKELKHMKGEKASPITSEMMSGDYFHLVKVFNREFGDLVVLETKNIDLIRFVGS
ncbi:hypothetical protein EB155_09045 [archaeon]|nr:hypothetical protein [archaeon]NDB80000.1 hypothetical protein [archaeon]